MKIRLHEVRSNNGRYGYEAEEKSGNRLVSVICINVFVVIEIEICKYSLRNVHV